jgi:hypothetical protein
MTDRVNLAEKLALFGDHWKPRTVAQLTRPQLLGKHQTFSTVTAGIIFGIDKRSFHISITLVLGLCSAHPPYHR